MGKPVRVLMIAPSKALIGGQGIQAARMLEGFAGMPGIAVTFQPIDPELPFGLRRVPGVRTVASALVLWTQLLFRIPAHDVTHVFTAAYWGFLLWTTPAILLARLCGRPVIVNYRDGQCEDHLRRWPGARATLGLATRIVTPSGYLADVVGRFGLRGDVIFNLIDLSRFRFRERARPRPVFLSNRALEPLYNIPCLFRAFGLIQKKYPEARLIVANDGPLRGELEALAGSLGLRNLEWRGRIQPADIAASYDEADVYLNTPDIDNMPGSLLECFASGLPIVTTGAGGIPYIVKDGETAMVTAVGDSEALAAAALRVLEEPGLSGRLTAQGLAEAERYRPAGVLGAWENMYATLLQ